MADLDQQNNPNNNRDNNPNNNRNNALVNNPKSDRQNYSEKDQQQNELNSGKGSGTNASIPKAILKLPPVQLPNTVESILDDLYNQRSKLKEQVYIEGEKHPFGKTIIFATECSLLTPSPKLNNEHESKFINSLGHGLGSEFNYEPYTANLKNDLLKVCKINPELRLRPLATITPRIYLQTRVVSTGTPNETIEVKVFDLESKQAIFKDFYLTTDQKEADRVLKHANNFLKELDLNKDIKPLSQSKDKVNLNYDIKFAQNTNGSFLGVEGLTLEQLQLLDFFTFNSATSLNPLTIVNKNSTSLNTQPFALLIHFAVDNNKENIDLLLTHIIKSKDEVLHGKDPNGNSIEIKISVGGEKINSVAFIYPNYNSMKKDREGNYIFDFDLGIISATNKLFIKPFPFEQESSGVNVKSEIQNLSSPLYKPFIDGFIEGAKEAYQFIGRKDFPIKNLYVRKGVDFNGTYFNSAEDSLFLRLANDNLVIPAQAKFAFAKALGRHEAFHAIDDEILREINTQNLKSEDKFNNTHQTALSNKAGQNNIFEKINESYFLEIEGGHSADNPEEAFASLLNSLYQRDNWQQKLDQMTPIERSYYKEFLDGLKAKLEHIGVSFIGDNLSDVAKEIIKRTNYILERDKK